MLKPTIGIGLVSFIVLSQSAIALATSVQDIPNPRRMNSWVADTADLLTPQTEAEIDRIATELAAKNGSEIAVVTVSTTKPAQSSKAFATQLFNTWKIGKQGKNNGVLFLISKSDRRTEIETGTGLTALLPDSKTKMILTQTITPQYKQGKFNEGTLAGTQAIAQALSDSPSDSLVGSSQPSALSEAALNVLPWILAGGFVTTFLFTLYAIISKVTRGLRSTFVRNSHSEFDHDGFDYDFRRLGDDDDDNSFSSFSSDSSSSDSSSSDSSSDSDSSSSSSSDFGGGSSDGGGSGDSW